MQFFKSVKKILEFESIDVLFTNMISIDSLIVPYIKTSIPKIIEVHRSNYLYKKVSWSLKKPIINRYKKVVILNKTETSYYNLNNLEVIPNFVNNKDSKDFKSIKRNIIISAGRIVQEKQFDHLVEIWSTIANKNLNWELHIYGDGSVEALREKIIEKKIQNSFKIYPGTSEIISKMHEAKIFVLVSKTEAFPMVLLEAMQAELPIVSYDSPTGPKNIVSDGKDGFIVPLNDKAAFSEKLDLLINDVALRESFIENQKIKLDTFSKKRVMNQWNDLLLEVLRK